ncbi:hypothetical protein GIB67_005234 [Kingdonia uniflora]|uniref:Uncharacterized protein n=1 Tax=Kingdonia uniflora TaxID=39325 RepID=A0A7J7NNU4_9MAGN|nr:hypothetical protein GIB67_005234 [Kingdonia uniflora]
MIRSIRPVTETYNITIQIYTLSEGRLLSQSIRSGRDALIQLFNIQYISLRSLIDMLNSTFN